VQLLSLELVGHDGSRFEVLDAALRRAAVRGVKVHLLLSNWQKTSKKIGAALGLAKVPGIEVKFVNVPADPRGFIPFARVVHAKYLVVDEDVAWVGTSNWGGDYFLRSRNLGVMVRSATLAAQLRSVFDRLAASSLAEVADPARTYEPPRIGE
jgi:phosphatidylserine/phosphatidylglycerophosphate/cardiolipin synthase-like enzyme